VLSHVGSGAEITLVSLERALDGRPALGGDDFVPIWDRWNALGPDERAQEMVVWDRRCVAVWQYLDEATLASFRATVFGMDMDMATLVGLRLGEHAVHSWDVAVSFDPSAELLPEATALVVDRLGWMASRIGKAGAIASPFNIAVHTTGPDRELFLSSAGDKVSLEEATAPQTDPGASLTLPAAALVRLVYGRLDPDHTPADVRTEGSADLDELRRVFPGI
jgi:hypothetical protein